MADKMDMDERVNVDLEPEDALRILLAQEADSQEDEDDEAPPEGVPA